MTTPTLSERVLAGDVRAVARAISLVEDESADGAALIRQIFAHTGRAYLVGVTGPPGAGKSTLVDRMTTELRSIGPHGWRDRDRSRPVRSPAAHSSATASGCRPMPAMPASSSAAWRRGVTWAVSPVPPATRRWCSTRREGHRPDRDRRRRPGRDRHRPHRGRLDCDARARILATTSRRSRRGSWRSQTSSSSTRRTAKAPIAPRASLEAMLSLQTYGPGEWRPPVLQTEATTGSGVAELLDDVERFRVQTPAERGNRRRARAEQGQASCCAAVPARRSACLAREFDALMTASRPGARPLAAHFRRA